MTNPYLDAHKRANLRAAQLKQLSILRRIDEICRRHDIGYWLDGGSLLGAVRHGGFIPWDDDIDIAMTLDDLRRFEQIAPAELGAGLMLQSPRTEPESKEPIVKVRDLNSFYVEPGDNFAAQYQKGLYVDIFPFIPYPTISRSLTRRLTRGYCRAGAILAKPHRYSWRAVAELLWFGAKKLACLAAWNTVCLLRPHDTYFGNTIDNNGYGTQHRRDSIFPLGTITFEGHTFSAPADTDAYLKDLYKDYMIIPPPEKRQIHSVIIIPELVQGPDLPTHFNS